MEHDPIDNDDEEDSMDEGILDEGILDSPMNSNETDRLEFKKDNWNDIENSMTLTDKMDKKELDMYDQLTDRINNNTNSNKVVHQSSAS